MTCKDCLHGELCDSRTELTPFTKTEYRDLDNVEKFCEDFKNKTDFAEVKHGEWLPQIVLGQRAWDCSECKTLGSPRWGWCPMCGAKMDGKEDT